MPRAFRKKKLNSEVYKRSAEEGCKDN